MKVAVLDDYQNVALKLVDWSSLPAEVEIEAFHDNVKDLDFLAQRLQPFEIVCLMRERTPFRRELMENLPNLRLLMTSGMANAAIDLAAATDQGVLVCGTGGVASATAELTWGLILALLRSIPLEDRAVREGCWQSTLGTGLDGKTLGILGLGRLGAQVARVGLAFNMRVIAWSQNLTPERAEECGVTLVSKDELFMRSDVLSIHLRLSERTRGLVGAHELGLMRSSAYLINTSRGPIVNETPLLAALRAHKLGGAALDVYNEEPLSYEHPLTHLDNVVLTPHLGYVTRETYQRFYGDMVENIQAYIEGRPLRVLNPQVAG